MDSMDFLFLIVFFALWIVAFLISRARASKSKGKSKGSQLKNNLEDKVYDIMGYTLDIVPEPSEYNKEIDSCLSSSDSSDTASSYDSSSSCGSSSFD